eukprot:COSAG01_NODE_1233_length_11110_cov_13.006902_7_plen_47_part_00
MQRTSLLLLLLLQLLLLPFRRRCAISHQFAASFNFVACVDEVIAGT